MQFVFLTGAGGFIGRNLSKSLQSKFFNIIPIPRSVLIAHEELALNNFFSSFDSKIMESSVLIHLAAAGVNDQESIDVCEFVNVYCTHRLIDKAIRIGIPKIIMIGTCFEYGYSCNDFDQVPTTAQLRPVGSYAITKAKAFDMSLNKAHQFKGFSYLRLFQVYGPGELATRLYPSLISAAKSGSNFHMSDGRQIRDFTHIHQVTKYIIREISLLDGFSVINVASGGGTSVKDFANYYWSKCLANGELKLGSRARKVDQFEKIVGEPTVDEFRKPIPAFYLHTHV